MEQRRDAWREPVVGAGEGGPDAPWDFADDVRFHGLFYREPTPGEVRAFGTWLRARPNDFARLYHGTWAGHDVLGDGLKPATAKRRNSYASANGYVYLGVHRELARRFGVMAAANRGEAPDGARVAVYPVVVSVRRLGPDPGQLVFGRLWRRAEPQCSGLAASLVYGQAARVRGAVAAHQIEAPERCGTDRRGATVSRPPGFGLG